MCVWKVPASAAWSGNRSAVEKVSKLAGRAQAPAETFLDGWPEPLCVRLRFLPVPLRQDASRGPNDHPAPFGRRESLSGAKGNPSGFLLGKGRLHMEHEAIFGGLVCRDEAHARFKEAGNEMHVAR